MAKRKGQEGQIKRLLKVLPTALLVMIICVGVLLGVLIETGRLSLSDVQQTMGFTQKESQAAGDTIPEAAKEFLLMRAKKNTAARLSLLSETRVSSGLITSSPLTPTPTT